MAAKNSVRGIVRIDPKVIEHHLRRIYERENPSGAWIESGMYRAVRDILESAVDDGTSSSQQAAVSPLPASSPSPDLAAALKRSADVFAAHKVHRIQQDMARLLVDDQGNLRSFREWRELVTPIAAYQVGPWLQTEYSTAVLRAQQAVEWQQFEAEADVLPNLRWVPSTAVHPGADHQVFWNTILPIHHPFWDQHRPGDRWNCHCSLEATDEQPTAPPKGYELRGNGPQPGLNENPAKTGRLFAQSHPYFPQSCAQCAFYQGGIAGGFKNQEKDCQSCKYLGDILPSPSGYAPDASYGERLLISSDAHGIELDDNIRAAKNILDSFPETKIKIREHVYEHKKRNPEYEIDGLLADRKGIRFINGVTDGFKKAIEQGCSAIVIDLDMHMSDVISLDMDKLASKLKGRHKDFTSGVMKRCYIIRHEKVCLLDSSHYINGNDIRTKQIILSILREKIQE